MENINAFAIAIDYVVLFAVFVIAAFFTLRRGPSVVKALIISLPLTFVAFELAKTSFFLGDFIANIQEQPNTIVSLYGVMFLALYIALRSIHRVYGEVGAPVQAALAGAALVGMMLTIWSALPILQEIRTFPAFLAPYFAAEYIFLWFAASLALLYAASSRTIGR